MSFGKCRQKIIPQIPLVCVCVHVQNLTLRPFPEIINQTWREGDQFWSHKSPLCRVLGNDYQCEVRTDISNLLNKYGYYQCFSKLFSVFSKIKNSVFVEKFLACFRQLYFLTQSKYFAWAIAFVLRPILAIFKRL